MSTYFICLTIVLFPDSPAPGNKNTNNNAFNQQTQTLTIHFYKIQCSGYDHFLWDSLHQGSHCVCGWGRPHQDKLFANVEEW